MAVSCEETDVAAVHELPGRVEERAGQAGGCRLLKGLDSHIREFAIYGYGLHS